MTKQQYIEDLEERLSVVLCHATGGLLSKTNYTTEVMIRHIDRAQERLHYGIVNDDISGIIDSMVKDGEPAEEIIEEIKEYLVRLSSI